MFLGGNMTNKNKTNRLYIIIILIGFVLSLIIINSSLDLYNKAKLRKEISSINSMLNADNFDEEKLDKKLNKLITENDYRKVEASYKDYLKDNISMLNEIDEFFINDETDEILTIDNIKLDGKEFKVSKETLKTNKENLSELKEKYDNSFKEDYVLGYIKDKKLKTRYNDFYKKEILDNLTKTKVEKEVSKGLDNKLKEYEKIDNVLNFLIEHKDNYIVKDGNIVFDEENLLLEYNKLAK